MNKKKLQTLLKESKNRSRVYSNKIFEVEKSFRELDSANNQATLIQFEDYLDNNHLYAFKNWIEGVVWDGPNIRRYWVDLTLKYPRYLMPDPKGAMRLVNSGAIITFKEDTEIVSVRPEKNDDLDPMTRKPKEKEEEVWLITIQVPRRFIENAIEDYEELEPQPVAQEPEIEELPDMEETDELDDLEVEEEL